MELDSLEVNIQKFCDGDSACIDSLCRQLADAMFYVPITSPVSDDPNSTTVKVVERTEDSECLVPVFTTEESLKKWSKSNEHDGESICLLGIDFCSALGRDKWLVVNEESDYAIALEPLVVRKILQFSKPENIVPDSVAYSKPYDVQQEEQIEDLKQSPIDYHGKVNEKNFIRHVNEAVDLHKEAIQEVETVRKVVEAAAEDETRDRKKTSLNISLDEEPRVRKKTSFNITPQVEEAPRERKKTELHVPPHVDGDTRERKETECNIKSWEDDPKEEGRARKKTAQEGADGAMQAWHMLRDIPVTEAVVDSEKTKVMQLEINPMDLSDISNRLGEGKNKSKTEEEPEDKTIWDIFK